MLTHIKVFIQLKYLAYVRQCTGKTVITLVNINFISQIIFIDFHCK